MQDASVTTRSGLGELVCGFKSIGVRAVEILDTFDEALRLIERYEPPYPPTVEVEPRGSTGTGWSETPRGTLWHRPVEFVRSRLGCRTSGCGGNASRRSATTTRASRARPTSASWTCIAGEPAI